MPDPRTSSSNMPRPRTREKRYPEDIYTSPTRMPTRGDALSLGCTPEDARLENSAQKRATPGCLPPRMPTPSMLATRKPSPVDAYLEDAFPKDPFSSSFLALRTPAPRMHAWGLPREHTPRECLPWGLPEGTPRRPPRLPKITNLT
ncbi:hypothetical protein H5410_033578 [Solanum commersonii]|uniref:Uncharacterized protein n=1 Tax=Solanum commersonii TaxID=4109 RepID=A0A9J5YR80_SOLCO|nr:hypothetical protein H5410_033578 [Solanum commersonii]